ncbi:type I restriction-modification enzyme R subunit C-terminal domain-containing protein [Vibrio cyclitrophicus]
MNEEDRELLAQAGAKEIVNTKVVEIKESHVTYCCDMDLEVHGVAELNSRYITFDSYKEALLGALTGSGHESLGLLKIREGKRVNELELADLDKFFLEHCNGLGLSYLKEFFPESTAELDQILRTIVGVDEKQIEHEFTEFVQQVHTHLNSRQQRFLGMLKNHLCRYGSVDIEALYDAPFNQIDDAGLDGVFPNPEQADVVEQFVRRFSVHLGNKHSSVEKPVN